MNENYDKLLDLLLKLKNDYYASALKLELETEIISTSEIDLVKSLVDDAKLDLTVKVSGCSAVSDIFLCKALQAKNIFVPMVESPYALNKFYKNIKNILEDKEISLLFNIETVNAWKNIDEILGYENIDVFDAVVFGRNDFCSSIGKTADYVDSDEIFDVAENILRKIQNKKLKFFLGGNVSMSSFDFMKRLNCEKFKNFETRKITFDTRCLDKDFQKALLLALEFEFLWLNSKSFANVIDERRKYVIQQRLANVV